MGENQPWDGRNTHFPAVYGHSYSAYDAYSVYSARMQRIQRFQRVLRAVCNYGKKTHALGILRMAQNCGKTRILGMPKNVEIDPP